MTKIIVSLFFSGPNGGRDLSRSRILFQLLLSQQSPQIISSASIVNHGIIKIVTYDENIKYYFGSLHQGKYNAGITVSTGEGQSTGMSEQGGSSFIQQIEEREKSGQSECYKAMTKAEVKAEACSRQTK